MLYILGLKPVKDVAPEKEPKVRDSRADRVLSCTCGKVVKVSRYRCTADYKCHTCRPIKEVVV